MGARAAPHTIVISSLLHTWLVVRIAQQIQDFTDSFKKRKNSRTHEFTTIHVRSGKRCFIQTMRGRVVYTFSNVLARLWACVRLCAHAGMCVWLMFARAIKENEKSINTV